MKQKKEEEAKNGLYVYQPGKKNLCIIIIQQFWTVRKILEKKYKNFSFDINGVPQKFTAII